MKTSPRCGLSLVELIVTIGLAGIIGIPSGILFSEHLNAALAARDTGMAMNLARDAMEHLDSFNDVCHAELALGTSQVAYPAYPSYIVTKTISCQVGNCNPPCPSAVQPPPLDADNGVKRIQIVVTRSGSTKPLATLVSYRTKFVSFGS